MSAGYITQPFNGWANWATWAATLWARNEEGNYAAWMSLAAELKGEQLERIAEKLEAELPGLIHAPDMSEGDWSEVDWLEVAEALAEDAE